MLQSLHKQGEHVHSIAVEDPTSLTVDSRGDLWIASHWKECV